MSIFKNELVCNKKIYSNINYTFLKEYLEAAKQEKIILVTNTSIQAKTIYDKLKGFLNLHLFIKDDFTQDENEPLINKIGNADLFTDIYNNKIKVIITNLASLSILVPSEKNVKENGYIINKGSILNTGEFSDYLINAGYEKVSLVTEPATFAKRGFILDVCDIDGKAYRISLFDDEVENIKEFDLDTQRSKKEVKELKVRRLIYQNGEANLLDVISDHRLILINQLQIADKIQSLADKNLKKKLENADAVLNFYYGENNLDINFLPNHLLIPEAWIGKTETVLFNVSDKQSESISKLFPKINHLATSDKIFMNQKNLIIKNFLDSFKYKEKYYINLDAKIPLTLDKRPKYDTTIDEISIGDYIVHDKYGIGQYIGLVHLIVKKIKKEYLKIKYAKTDTLYVPVEKIGYLRKYDVIEGVTPKLHSLNGVEWAKTKLRVQKHLAEIAGKIIEVAAQRKQEKGISFKYDAELNDNFNQACEFDLTPDQEKVWEEIKISMMKTYPMDRLVCGDVGFGKTEVAFRAAFLAIANGYQVMYLCPTTILAKQQYEKAKSRFRNQGVNIALFDRTISSKQANETIAKVKEGQLDFIIGTHRVLNDDLKFKSLGLMIIDEEQRFGVMLKEKIKQKQKNADIISLSATPIPRTLQMSLSGLKDFSTINTAPMNRMPVTTYVMPHHDNLIKEAILNEIERKGQVFYLQNRITKFNHVYNKLTRMLPNLRIAMIHGKLSKEKSEQTINAFLSGDYDVLIATTIIETGVDMPNVNTIIVEDAHMLGLAQLYQLKGRVGRSDIQAYAYLLIHSEKIITNEASARLDAIREFTKLGSGIEIAKRDLAIRGAGDILGKEQAGFMNRVGIDLYNKMLSDELKKLDGQEVNEEIYETPLLLVATNCLEPYIDDEKLRVEMHSLISTIKDETSYEHVKLELKDRFNAFDDVLNEYLLSIWFEKIAREMGVFNVTNVGNKYQIYIQGSKKINIKKIINDFTYNINKDTIIINYEANSIKDLINFIFSIKN